MDEPGWITHAIWWHVYPLGFAGADVTGADRTPGRGLARLTAWLDYAVQLGVSGLALGPVFASSTHGYDTVDHFRIDERLGTEEDFDELVAQAGERGLRIVLDGVFNHVGRGFGHADWIARRGDRERTFEGHDALLALDHRNPAVADHVVAVMDHWLARGAAGWRLDAAYAVDRRFWADVLPRVRERHPDAYLYGEVIHGDYPAVVRDARLDSVTQYELWKAIRSAIAERNLFELAHALRRHDGFVESFVPQTFVGNHDVTRLASAITDARHLPHALVVLFTVAGLPSVYYGDEQGMTGVKQDRAGGDDAVRPAYPDVPEHLPGDGAEIFRLHQEFIGLRRRHAWLHAARLEIGTLTNTALGYTMRAGEHRLRVALNLGDEPADVDGQTVAPHGWTVRE